MPAFLLTQLSKLLRFLFATTRARRRQVEQAAVTQPQGRFGEVLECVIGWGKSRELALPRAALAVFQPAEGRSIAQAGARKSDAPLESHF
jgi:hypothetical protein